MEQMNDFVVAGLGIGTVFAALVCIILMCEITGAIFRRAEARRGKAVRQAEIPSADAVGSIDTDAAEAENGWVPAVIGNRGEVLAAVASAIAEDLGTDAGHLRILSVKESAYRIPDREKVCAAISAAIAEETGAAGVRICSLRRV